MKLKKIASVALAGVMAVSMLAGCGTKAPATNGETENTTTSSIVAAVNAAQDDLAFTDSDNIDKALQRAVELGADAGMNDNDLTEQFNLLSGYKMNGVDELPSGTSIATRKNNVNFLKGDFKDASYTNVQIVDSLMGNTYKVTDGTVLTYVDVAKLSALNAEAAEKQVVNLVKNAVSELEETTYKEEAISKGEHYFDYSYTGHVALTSYTTTTGVTNYYYAIVMTQTVSAKTVGE